MGCAGSKLDDLQAVALCRDRASRLDDAIRLRYALAEAHVHYLKSLRSIGESLHFFFDSAAATGAAAASPLLPLPQRRKLDPDTIPAAEGTAALGARGHSHSGSHIDFLSESESGSPLSGDESPFHADHRDFDLAGGGGYGPPQPETQYFYNYMRSQPPAAAVTYEQPPPASGYMSDPSTSSAPAYGYAYPYDYDGNFAGAGGAGFFGSLPQGGYYPSSSPPMQPAASTSGSRAPPPPPSPPRASTWDFFNPFETFERFYPAAPASASYTPSRDSREVREEEGIPELEEEEVVKEVSAVHDGGDGGYAASGPPPSVLVEDEATVEDAVDKNVVGGGESSMVEGQRSSVTAAYKAVRASLSTADAVREIKLEFERAADSGCDVAKMLEAGKLPYHRRTAVHKASSKMRNAITPSLLASSTSLVDGKDGSLFDDVLENKAMQAGNLSCTLLKLYIWERKLYAEVKAEEKLRVTLEQKCRRLKHLDERGAEAHKIDATRAYIHKLSTRIRIAIQVVESVSNTISKLRDEELWPEIRELIQGMVMMWRMMFECHKNQFLIVSEGKNLDHVVSMGKLDEARVEATRRLEYDMLNWISRFHSWISLQKDYVKSINEWLLKCIDTNPEVTADGVAPFSPGRMGAPSVFVICYQWAQVMDRTSALEVFEAMQSFAATVLQLLDKYNMEQRQRLTVDKDMDRRLKDLDGESQRLQKTIESVNKKLSGAPLPGEIVHRLHDQNDRSLHLSLKHLFGAMEKFSADSMRAYEELRTRSEENG